MKTDITRAVESLKTKITGQPKIGLILGSGLGGIIDQMTDTVRIGFDQIPDFPQSSVKGHSGELIYGLLNGVEILALSGRVHYYEGYSMDVVTVPIRVMIGLGLDRIIVTNAAGAVNELFAPGEIVSISDHINFMGDNPLKGSASFVDLTSAYSSALRDIASQEAKRLSIPLHSGVYVAFSGPCYETPAEVRMARTMGGDMVGMSTVPEVIVANALGVEILGLSMMTNMAAGISGQPLSHQEVIETSARASESFVALVSAIVARIDR